MRLAVIHQVILEIAFFVICNENIQIKYDVILLKKISKDAFPGCAACANIQVHAGQGDGEHSEDAWAALSAAAALGSRPSEELGLHAI